MQTSTVLESASILGKRKATHDINVLLLASSPEPSAPSDSDFETSKPSTSRVGPSGQPILVNGSLVPQSCKRYQCTYTGCGKAYSKPARLAEHERSHTGQRPFVCNTCKKSYLRDTHLQAHARSHLPASERPFVCPENTCEKRFWTSQHLRAHVEWHNGAKPFPCTQSGCSEAFSKHHQLRAHTCLAHAPPGTKPFQCTREGCTKSFGTNQHVKTHMKVHEERRYTCVHPTCLSPSGNELTYYPTWTALQHHLRTIHPPTCPYPSCSSKTFSSQKGFRAHLKLHEAREEEVELEMIAAGSDEGQDGRPYKRRRGGEGGRDWKCEFEGCMKDFKSKKALTTHTNVTHLGRRDYVCPHPECKQAFGYKHLLQRHLIRVHPVSDSNLESEPGSEAFSDEYTEDAKARKLKVTANMKISDITGQAYATRAEEKLQNAKALRCPFPHLDKMISFSVKDNTSQTGGPDCDYVFSRAYDLKRHLRATHHVDLEKDIVDQYVKKAKLSYVRNQFI